jgi:hypothetical protein
VLKYNFNDNIAKSTGIRDYIVDTYKELSKNSRSSPPLKLAVSTVSDRRYNADYR